MPKPKHQTTAQRVVEAFFTAHNAAAMPLRGTWVWLDQVRNDPDLAEAFIADRAEGYRNSEILRAWLSDQSGRTVQ